MGLEPGSLMGEAELRGQLGACGRGLKVYQGCRMVPARRVWIGDYTQVDEGVRIYAGEEVRIGRHVHLAIDCCISGGGWCEIGDHAGISGGVRILTGTEDIRGGLTNPTVPAEMRRVRRERTRIGAHALIFTGTMVLPGVTVGEGAVVAAGSVVHRDLEPWKVYAGNPLVCVGTREREAILAMAEDLARQEAARERLS